MAERRLKVYGWTGHRREAGGHSQTREIVAASSVAEIMRLTGARRSDLWNICETGNSAEIEAATAAPRVVLWRPLDDRKGPWRRAEGDSP